MLDQIRAVADQVVPHGDLHAVELLPEPAGDLFPDPFAAAEQQRHTDKVLGAHRFLFRKRRIAPHQNAVALAHRHADERVPADVHGLHQQPHVEQAVFHAVLDVVGRRAVNPEAHARVELPKGHDLLGQHGKAARLGAADRDLAGERALAFGKLLLRLVRKRDDLLRALLEQQSLLGQRDAVFIPVEQLHPKLLLELDELPRKRRLRHMQKPGGARDVLLPRHHQKIPQNTQFHALSSPFRQFFSLYRFFGPFSRHFAGCSLPEGNKDFIANSAA